MIPSVHIPIDFERREATRLFVRKLGCDEQTAMLCAYQIWMEWATCAQPWRPLRGELSENPREHDWGREDLAHVIESFTPWRGETGGLILAALESGFMRLEARGEARGLELCGFWDINKHLDPNFRTMQQRGADALNAKRRNKEIENLAEQRQKLFDNQGVLPFGDRKPSVEEQKACYALILRLDRVSGRLGMRFTSDYSESLLKLALDIVRRHTSDEILAVETYLYEQRENPSVVKQTERVIEKFAEYVAAVAASV